MTSTDAKNALTAANEILDEAVTLHAGGARHGVPNRVYYSMFTAAKTLLSLDGHKTKKHSGVKRLFCASYVKTGKIDQKQYMAYNKAFESRMEGDYMLASYSKQELASLIGMAREFNRIVAGIVESRLAEMDKKRDETEEGGITP